MSGRRHTQPAVLARHVPGLAVADVVKQALVIAVQHHADVGDAGGVQIGEHEIDDAVASAERDGGGHPAFRQLAQSRLLFVGENDAVQSVHRTVSFPSRLSIRFALSVRPASTCASGPTTVMPHSSGGAASGDAPTRAFSPTRTFSPRMA